MSMSLRTTATLSALAAACLFGTTGTAAALAPDDASSTSVGLGRLVVGGAVLLLATAARPRTGTPVVRSSSTTTTILLGAAAVVGYQALFFLGAARNGAALGALVTLGSAPVVAGALEAAWQRRSPGRTWTWTTAVAILGVVLVSGVLDGGHRPDAVGLLASVGAGVCYATYVVLASSLIGRGGDQVRTMAVMFGVAAAAALPWWLSTDLSWIAEVSGLTALVWLGVGATAVGYVTLARAMTHLPSATVTTLTLAEALTATVLGTILLDEHLASTAPLGILALGIALVALARQPREAVSASRGPGTTGPATPSCAPAPRRDPVEAAR